MFIILWYYIQNMFLISSLPIQYELINGLNNILIKIRRKQMKL